MGIGRKIATDIAEGFKQGAETEEASDVVEVAQAPCLKSLCAKPLDNPRAMGFERQRGIARAPGIGTSVRWSREHEGER
jgi:hypothetical protein